MKPFIVGVFGATGSGKGVYIRQLLTELNPPRLMMWDPLNEYGEFAQRVETTEAMLAMARLMPGAAAAKLPEEFRGRYVPTGTEKERAAKFDVFCRIAWHAGRVLVVVEECQMVTKPGAAPAAWSDLTLRGRHQQIGIIAASQRPALVDKNLFSNATLIRCGRVNFAEDANTLAGVIGCKAEDIVGLSKEDGPGWARMEYVQRDMQSGEVERGYIEVGKVPAARREVPAASPDVPGVAAKKKPAKRAAKKKK